MEMITMSVLIALASVALILLVLRDAFEAMLLPRRVTRQFRFARLFYVYSWRPWAALAGLFRPSKRRNTFLSLYGPLSILVLFGFWAVGLIVGFALLQWSLGSPLHGPDGRPAWAIYGYFSGVTFFTLGYGDVTPVEPLGRFLAVVESGIGFGFLAVVISYLPVLYQAFSRREVTISPARRPRRLAADGRPAPEPAGPVRRPRAARSVPGGVGAMGGRGAGEPHLVPGPELLPLAARQPVVAGGADGDPRHLGAGGRGGAEGRPLPGVVDVRHGPARRGGPVPGLSRPARRSRRRPAPPERLASPLRAPRRRRAWS